MWVLLTVTPMTINFVSMKPSGLRLALCQERGSRLTDLQAGFAISLV